MKTKQLLSLFLAAAMVLALCACEARPAAPGAMASEAPEPSQSAQTEEMMITDMIGREISVVPGSYERVVCIGAGALRMYSYIGDVGLLCGVEDIDNLSLQERPQMFDGVARPYVLAYKDVFSKLDSCGVGGPTRSPPKRRRSSPASRTSSYPNMRTWTGRTLCRSSWECRL